MYVGGAGGTVRMGCIVVLLAVHHHELLHLAVPLHNVVLYCAVQSPLLHYIRQYSPLLFRRTEQRYACPIRLQNATKLTRLLLGTGDL